MAHVPSTRDIVVVSGAGSGIGFDSARHLATLGYTVVTGVRSDSQAARLSASAPPSLLPFRFDVTSDEDVSNAVSFVEQLCATGSTVRGIFSNAGVDGRSDDLSAEGCPIAALESIMAVNYLGAVRFIQGFLPLLRRYRGTVVVNSALMARVVIPFNGGYAPSKAALESWAIGLRREIAPHGVRVTLVELGGIATPLTMHVRADPAPNSLYPGQAAIMAEFAKMAREGADTHAMQPQRVAEIVARALASPRPRTRYLGGGGAHILAVLATLPQRLKDLILARRLR